MTTDQQNIDLTTQLSQQTQALHEAQLVNQNLQQQVAALTEQLGQIPDPKAEMSAALHGL